MRFSRWTLSALALLAGTSLLLDSHGSTRVFASAAEAAKEAERKEDAYTPPANAKHFEFQAEVHKMLDIVVNSLYQNKDVFLRELISNASDALDKIRFLSLTKPELLKAKESMEVRVEFDPDAGTLTVRDTGIGMTQNDLIENLGTVAKSGTTKFVEAMQKSETGELGSLIGKFGVGFYSSFLVADRVTVASKHPDSDKQYVWESVNGSSDFHIYEDPRGDTLGRGTEITLHLKEDCFEYADPVRLKELIQHYSEFVMHPIHLRTKSTVEVEVDDDEDDSKAEKADKDDLKVEDNEDAEVDEDKEDKPKKTKEVTTFNWEEINVNPAIWNRDKDDVTEEEYQTFWKLLSKQQFANATTWTHFNAEGNINFKSILYLPSEIPDSYRYGQIDPVEAGMRLYVRKVLISDSFDLMPRYLGFIRGVIDSDDLPLNVNRETLQESKIIQVIKKKLVRKVLEMIRSFSKEEDDDDKEDSKEAEVDADGNIIEAKKEKTKKESKYVTWYKKFAPSIKMGILDDEPNRGKLTKLLRFQTTKSNGTWISLEDYVANMKEWQDEIYVLAGVGVEHLEKSPFLEPFREKDVEVVYLTDAVDEYMIQQVRDFEGKKLVAISNENAAKFKDEDEDLIKRREKAYKKKFKPLTKWLKGLYGTSVVRVVISKRLGTSPAIMSSSEYGHSANMERIMRAQVFNHEQNEFSMRAMKILEINPRHPFILKLLAGCPPTEDDKDFKVAQEVVDSAWLLHDIALLNGGYPILDTVAHTARVTKFLQSQLGVQSMDLEPEINPPVEEEKPPEVDNSESAGLNSEDFNLDDLDFD